MPVAHWKPMSAASVGNGVDKQKDAREDGRAGHHPAATKAGLDSIAGEEDPGEQGDDELAEVPPGGQADRLTSSHG